MAFPAAGMLGELAVTGDLATAWASWENAIKAGALFDTGLATSGAFADYVYKRSKTGPFTQIEKRQGDFMTPPRKNRNPNSAPPFISPIKKNNSPIKKK